MPSKKGSSNKLSFLLAMYATLIVQLFITFAIVYWFRDHPKLSAATKQSFWIYLLLSLGLILILAFVPMPPWLQLVIFTAFAVVTGAMLHKASAVLPKETIDSALKGAISIFVTMSIVGVVLLSLGFDLSWMGWILFAGLLGLLIASIVVILIPKENKSPLVHKVLTIVGLALFSAYVMYHTNIVLQRNYSANFVQAALDFYLDFINIFVRMLVLENA